MRLGSGEEKSLVLGGKSWLWRVLGRLLLSISIIIKICSLFPPILRALRPKKIDRLVRDRMQAFFKLFLGSFWLFFSGCRRRFAGCLPPIGEVAVV